jgi:hypothetical protein
MKEGEYHVLSKNYRAWINQPSTLQPDHALHGKRGIVVNDTGEDYVTIWFTEGPVHSMRIARLSISKFHDGNPNHSFSNLVRKEGK